VAYQVVNVATLEKLFPQGGTVGLDELVEAGAVRKGEPVKVLGDGDLSVKLDVTANAFSESARAKISAAGGTATKL
jgi:large subunit ribosomal protein L15